MTVGKLEGKDIEEVKRELEKPEEELYDLTPSLETLHAEEEVEEAPAPLDLPELEPQEEHAEPLLDIGYHEESTEEEDTSLHDEIYDYGLAVESGDEPLVILEDEEEILNELENFDADEESSLPDIQDFDTVDDTPEAELPTLTFDVNTAAAEIGLSADLVSALIDDYIVEANEMKSKLNDVIASADVMRWKGYATQLKGVSDNLRINEISDALQKLISSSDETQAKAAMQEFYGFINQL
jgi:hypothetical protein